MSLHGALALWFELLSLGLPGERVRETDYFTESKTIPPSLLLTGSFQK